MDAVLRPPTWLADLYVAELRRLAAQGDADARERLEALLERR